MKHFVTVALFSAVLLGCASEPKPPAKTVSTYDSVVNSPFISNNYRAADALISQLGNRLNSSQPVIVATIVNIDALSSSSTFGRLVSEQVSGRFSQANYSMVEMKFRGDVYMKQDQGELLLTREIKNVAQSQNAQAVIVGTYAESGDTVFVNLKVIQPNTNIVMAVNDYAFPLDNNIRTMLKKSGR